MYEDDITLEDVLYAIESGDITSDEAMYLVERSVAEDRFDNLMKQKADKMRQNIQTRYNDNVITGIRKADELSSARFLHPSHPDYRYSTQEHIGNILKNRDEARQKAQSRAARRNATVSAILNRELAKSPKEKKSYIKKLDRKERFDRKKLENSYNDAIANDDKKTASKIKHRLDMMDVVDKVGAKASDIKDKVGAKASEIKKKVDNRISNISTR